MTVVLLIYHGIKMLNNISNPLIPKNSEIGLSFAREENPFPGSFTTHLFGITPSMNFRLEALFLQARSMRQQIGWTMNIKAFIQKNYKKYGKKALLIFGIYFVTKWTVTILFGAKIVAMFKDWIN